VLATKFELLILKGVSRKLALKTPPPSLCAYLQSPCVSLQWTILCVGRDGYVSSPSCNGIPRRNSWYNQTYELGIYTEKCRTQKNPSEKDVEPDLMTWLQVPPSLSP
jgi:hypothetical protein